MAHSDPTRLALAITDLKVGGAGKCLVELATRIDRTRFEPAVYSVAPIPTGESTDLVERLQAAQVPVHFLDARSPRDFWAAKRRLVDLLRAQSPRILQTFLFHANVLGRLAAKKAGVPVILSGVRVAERERRWHLWLDRQTQGCVARHVCVSQAVARFCETHAGLPADKLVVIPNGIDLEKYPASQRADLTCYGIASTRRAITYLGRLHKQKGLEWLLATARDWLARLPDADLLLVGKGPEQDRLELLAQRSGFAKRIHFLDWQADVAEILAASRLLVLPSRWEGMPNAVLEAMASRLPVVATDVEGVRELLGPHAEPQTAAYGDTQAFSQKLLAIMNDASLAEELGAANRQRAQQCFSVTRMVQAYEEAYERLKAES